jgi:hypothetical protein
VFVGDAQARADVVGAAWRNQEIRAGSTQRRDSEYADEKGNNQEVADGL